MPPSKPSGQFPPRDAWYPSQVLLQPSLERDDAEIEDLDLARMDDDPFIYFLTPTPSSYADDAGLDFDMEFDAGIEDAKHPPQIVRSVSPSSLVGLSLPPPRPPTPPRSPGTPDLEYDLSTTPDDHESYDYMDNSWPPQLSVPMSLPRRLKDKFRGGHAPAPLDDGDTLQLPPGATVPHSPRTSSSSRGRAASRSGGPGPAAGAGASVGRRRPRGRLSPHAWREPSPDVWAIEEETEEEVVVWGGSEVEEEGGMTATGGGNGGHGKGVVEIQAAKPKKRVRFVLPVVEHGR
ncbi:hypothetical protein C8A05DRAFT_12295 [Staphylotrichum tortipilum]|uniref:Uncharacterized protein n=1 Tax=Staphylotrichum tortipilum TaxID=2831512 RepID=A0AAN6MS61_9PEZI|nr:hypothetical protein C8A05DRAFT_12295 [Staphylotrichum longicolle]